MVSVQLAEFSDPFQNREIQKRGTYSDYERLIQVEVNYSGAAELLVFTPRKANETFPAKEVLKGFLEDFEAGEFHLQVSGGARTRFYRDNAMLHSGADSTSLSQLDKVVINQELNVPPFRSA